MKWKQKNKGQEENADEETGMRIKDIVWPGGFPAHHDSDSVHHDGVFSVSLSQADLLFKLLFAVYGALLTEYMGMTAGKYFGKLRVADNRGGKAPILYVGLRELTKSLYLIPWLGWGLALVSLVMMAVRRDGRTLHDLVGNTRVMTARRFEQEERE